MTKEPSPDSVIGRAPGSGLRKKPGEDAEAQGPSGTTRWWPAVGLGRGAALAARPLRARGAPRPPVSEGQCLPPRLSLSLRPLCSARLIPVANRAASTQGLGAGRARFPLLLVTLSSPLDVSSGSPPREAFPDPSERAAGLGSSAPCTAGGARCTGPRRGPLPVGGLPDLQLRTLLEKSSAIDSYIRLWFTSSSGSNLRCPGKDRSSAKAMKPRWGPACCSLRQTATGGRCSSTEAEPAEPSELCSIFSSLFTKVLYCLQSVKNCCSACLVAYYCLLLYFSPSSPLTSDV